MKTFLAPNQFLSAASLQPAASSPLSSLSEAAVTNSVSDGVVCCSLPSGESDPSVRLDFPPSGTEAAVRRTAVSVILSNRPLDVPPGPKLPAASFTVAAGLSDDDLYWQLRFADDPFTRDLAEIPDPHALFNKIIEVDVWADDAPLFLKRRIA